MTLKEAIIMTLVGLTLSFATACWMYRVKSQIEWQSIRDHTGINDPASTNYPYGPLPMPASKTSTTNR